MNRPTASTSPDIVAVAGPNGAGKSTVGARLLEETLGIRQYVNADDIARGLSAFAPESAAFEAGRIMLRRMGELARRRETFAFETTLSGRGHARLIGELIAPGYSFHLIYLWLQSPELALQRVAERVRRGGHSVADAVVRRRYQRGLRNFRELYRPLATT
jgi:predicted ABC-type ATPase